MLSCGTALAGYFDDLQHPMTVVVVRASDKRCEPNCPQWIAAEGKIDASAVEKFRKLLANIGGGRYPILIDSTGGDFDAAIEIARLIQSNSLMVAVSTTGYVGCTPTKEFCSNPQPADVAYKGFPIFQGYCGGACVLVLAAGKVRAAGSAMAVVVEYGNSINLGGPAQAAVEDADQVFHLSGVSSDLLKMIFATKGADRNNLSPEELTSFNLINTQLWAGEIVSSEQCRLSQPPPHCVKSQ